MDNSTKSLNKSWNDSLSFLDNIYVKVVLYVVLILYSSTYFENINMYMGNIYKKYKFLNIIILLLIVFLGRKCPVIGILLGLSYIITLNYMTMEDNNNEPFGASVKSKAGIHEEDKESFVNSPESDFNYGTGTSEEDNVENFLPIFSSNNDEKEEVVNNKMKKDSSDCKSLYTPQFESVGDVCNPVNTFNDELNAQGLNNPEGFNSNVFGSPL
jgi:hypothetical protein